MPTLTLDLTDFEADAVAQFLKRLTFTSMREHAASDDEAYQIKQGLYEFEKALAQAGFKPR